MAGGKIIGGPFSDGVISQLNIRSKILAKNARTDQDIMLLTGKTGWVKLTSGVNVDGNSNLAQEYVLIGGQKGRVGTNTYSNYFGEAGKGFRPMPGITSVQIRSINRFGSLKEATITFNCWDRGQLTDLEKLYMRPGFTALLEWGHSMYTKDGVEPYDKHVETVSSFFKSGQTKEKIYEEIENLKAGSAYNYDGILGFVKNFSWSFRPDGGYDCTTTVISIGEIMESLTIDVDTPSVTDRNPTEGEDAMILPATMLQDVIVNIKSSDSILNIWNDIVAKFPNFVTKHIKVGGRNELDVARIQLESIKSGDQIDTTSTQYFTYISLRSFCELVNTLIIVDNHDNSVIKLNTDIRPLGETSSTVPACRFRSYKFHTSSDPNVCMLITETTKTWSYNEDLLTALQSNKVGSSNEILNIYVNLNFLQKQVAAAFAQPKESRTLLNLFQPILDELNTVLGNINEFALHYEESKFTYYIVDRKVETEKGELSKSLINITGLKSAVSKFDFTTKLSPALTTMIAISAQAGGADVGVEADALLRWNEGLSDRIMKKKTVKTSEAASNAAEDKQTIDKQQQERRTAINTALGAFYNQRQYDREGIEIARTQNIQYAAEYVQSHQAADNNAGPAGIIPFEVGIEMEGISGIKIGQAFTINEGIMPHKYDGVVGFIVTGIDHAISGNRWVTNLKAQTIILQGGGKTADKDYPVEESNENPDPKTKGIRPTSAKKIASFGKVSDSVPAHAKPILDTIAYTEGTAGVGSNGYDVLVGFGQIPGWTENYDKGHPNKAIYIPAIKDSSTAAGRYQFLGSTWKGLKLTDFSKSNQDLGGWKLVNAQAAAKSSFDTAKAQIQSNKIDVNANPGFLTFLDNNYAVWASLVNRKGESRYSGQSGGLSPADIYKVYTEAVKKYV